MAEREPPPVNGEGGPVRQPWRADHSSTDARVLHWGGDISGRVVPLLASMRRMAGDAAHPGGGGGCRSCIFTFWNFARGSCWIPGSYTPCTGLNHLILNGFFQRCHIGHDPRVEPVKTTSYAKLDQLRPWNPI